MGQILEIGWGMVGLSGTSSIRPLRSEIFTRQPTILREKTSVTKAT
jgi:hypothetical protein